MPELLLHVDPNERTYTGRELRSRFAADAFGIEGDSAVAFIGPCDVPTEALVDMDDAREGAVIRSAKMLHVIAEHASHVIAEHARENLEIAVCRQRLLVALAAEQVREKASPDGLVRRGDDIFIGERKLSVSIATVSPVSSLIHLGINVDPAGAPVPAIGLDELAIDPAAFARELLDAYASELAGIAHACVKVRPVP